MQQKKKRPWFMSVLGFLSTELLLTALHHYWWDSHPGSERRFFWSLLGAMVCFVPAFVLYRLAREYWPIFFHGSQEEHNGIQR